MVLGSAHTILIVDDSPAVWPDESARLLVPRRYFFFPPAQEKAGPSAGRGHLLQGTDEPEQDGQLDQLLAALDKIHSHYFDQLLPSAQPADDCPNVSASVAAVRKSVLEGQCVLFSHVIPTHKQSSPECNAAWQLAMELGAEIASDVCPAVTHVVAGADNTVKVKWAKENGVHVVSLEWLRVSSYMWKRADEKLFPINGKLEMQDLDQMRVLPPPQIQV